MMHHLGAMDVVVTQPKGQMYRQLSQARRVQTMHERGGFTIMRPPRPPSWRHWLALVVALTAFGGFVALLVHFVG